MKILYLPLYSLVKSFAFLRGLFNRKVSQSLAQCIAKFLYILALLSLSIPIYSQRANHTFEIKDGNFVYDGKSILIHSGEMHYPRVPKEYWRHRFRMLKAMGLNAVATYAFWNYHNTAPGIWDFKTGNRNLAEYIRTAQEEGLFVILRPGPYVCAEWEFGGYPWWLQNNKELVIRTNQPFLDSCKIYIQKLGDQVRDLQITHGGPIIMIQVENEFGSYMSQRTDIPVEQHRKYYLSIMQLLKNAGFDVPMFTSDGSWLFDNGAIPGILPTANGEGNIENLKKCVDKHYPGGPYMVAEYYPGWLDHWAEPFVKVGTDQVVQQVEEYLKNNISFNFYMAHGGTNFGFTAGANYNNEHDIQPDITSYDYDAPVSEAGWATPKYLAIRKLMQKYRSDSFPEIPQKIPVIVLPDIKLIRSACLFDWMKSIKPFTNITPLTFEELGLGYGYVLYSRSFSEPIQGELTIKGLRDYALVYVNKKKIGELNRRNKVYSLQVVIPKGGILDILVENMGRINYGAEIPNNKKGIITPVTINNFEVKENWEMYKIPMDNMPYIIGVTNKSTTGLPSFYAGSFYLKQTGDVFLDMSNWGKGIVFVNGYNLGRYWNVGPQQTLYLPGCWLKKGENQVLIFEMLNSNLYKSLKTTTQPILQDLK